MNLEPIPNPAVLAHLAVWGRRCPGHHGHAHPADDLTARAGRVMCGDCAAHVLAERGAA